MANGTKTQKNTLIELEFTIYGNSNKKIREIFYILVVLNNEFLLCMEFIHKNKIVLDIRNKIKNIDGIEYEIDGGESKTSILKTNC